MKELKAKETKEEKDAKEVKEVTEAKEVTDVKEVNNQTKLASRSVPVGMCPVPGRGKCLV